MYENIFLIHCYSYKIFGHKAIHCKKNTICNYARSKNDYGFEINDHRSRNVHGSTNKNYNPFEPLMNQNIVCYKCNNLGHKAWDYRLVKENAPIIKTEKSVM